MPTVHETLGITGKAPCDTLVCSTDLAGKYASDIAQAAACGDQNLQDQIDALGITLVAFESVSFSQMIITGTLVDEQVVNKTFTIPASIPATASGVILQLKSYCIIDTNSTNGMSSFVKFGDYSLESRTTSNTNKRDRDTNSEIYFYPLTVGQTTIAWDHVTGKVGETTIVTGSFEANANVSVLGYWV